MSAAANLERRAIAIRAVPKAAMIVAARAVKDQARIYGGRRGISRRGRGRRSVNLRARDDIRIAGDVTRCRIQGLPVGPWVWATTGTRAHAVGVKAYRGRKKVNLRLPGGWITGPVRHRGARGRGAWTRVQTAADRIVPEIFADEVHRALG